MDAFLLIHSIWSWASVHAGLELLIGLLGSSGPKQQLDGAMALCKLANKATTLSPVDAAPPSPTPQVGIYTSCLVLSLHKLSSKSLIFLPQCFHIISMLCIYVDVSCSIFFPSFYWWYRKTVSSVFYFGLFIPIRSLCTRTCLKRQ